MRARDMTAQTRPAAVAREREATSLVTGTSVHKPSLETVFLSQLESS